MSDQDLKAELERLKAENAKLKGEKNKQGITFKVGAKGGVSVYGLGKFPVTLYKEQWERLMDKKDELIDFINENESSLKIKE